MLSRVLVPLDGSATAEQALAMLPELPCRVVTLLRVVDSGADEERALADLAAVADRLATTGVATGIAVRVGDPAEEIVTAAADADLVVMTSAGRGAGGRRFFGSVADRVSRHAPVPTLVVRAGAAGADPVRVERLVVPLDGSPVATRAVPIARHLAGDRPLLAVGVVEPDADEATHRAHLEAVAAEDAGTVVDLRAGEPAAEVLAALCPGDLVVLTTHGGGGGQRWQIGHVAERIVRHAPVPVLLVRGDHAVR